MKYTLRKKHTLYDLLSTQIKIVLSLLTISIVGFLGYTYRNYIFSMIMKILLKFRIEILIFLGKYFFLPLSIIGIIYYIIDFSISIGRNRYIPLEKDELENYNIHTIEEYNLFLMKFLRGYRPLHKLRKSIIESAKCLEKENESYYSIKNEMYWEFSRFAKLFGYDMKDYDMEEVKDTQYFFGKRFLVVVGLTIISFILINKIFILLFPFFIILILIFNIQDSLF